jgi:hypothetical protein
MTDEEAERIFGSGLIFIGLKRPSRPIAPLTNEVTDAKTTENDEQHSAKSVEGRPLG